MLVLGYPKTINEFPYLERTTQARKLRDGQVLLQLDASKSLNLHGLGFLIGQIGIHLRNSFF